jgi:hypothetical protein
MAARRPLAVALVLVAVLAILGLPAPAGAQVPGEITKQISNRVAQATTTCFGRTATRVGGSNGEFIQGTEGSDVIHGGGGDDIIVGGGGNDYICGGSGSDDLYGGYGNDSLRGNSPEDDVLYGEAGVDYLYGSGGRDILIGHASNDQLYGEDGEDSIYDGYGSDIVDGGAPVLDTAAVGDFGHQCADGVTDTRISVYWSAASSGVCNGPAFPV